jgi:hypothetical protein
MAGLRCSSAIVYTPDCPSMQPVLLKAALKRQSHEITLFFVNKILSFVSGWIHWTTPHKVLLVIGPFRVIGGFLKVFFNINIVINLIIL